MLVMDAEKLGVTYRTCWYWKEVTFLSILLLLCFLSSVAMLSWCLHTHKSLGTLKHWPFYVFSRFSQLFKGWDSNNCAIWRWIERFLAELMVLKQNHLAGCFNPEFPYSAELLSLLIIYVFYVSLLLASLVEASTRGARLRSYGCVMGVFTDPWCRCCTNTE